MPAPIKWMPDASLNLVGPSGEPDLLSLQNGRFAIGYTQGPPQGGADRSFGIAVSRPWPAAFLASESISFAPGSIRSGPGLAQTSNGAIIAAYVVEPSAGGGDVEDVHLAKAFNPGNGVTFAIASNRLFSGGSDQQLHPAVAAGLVGDYGVAWADYSGADFVRFQTFSITDQPRASFVVNTTPGLYPVSVGTQNYRPIAVESLTSGNYVVGWTGVDSVARFRVVNEFGYVSNEFPLQVGGQAQLWPDIAELADGRFVVTYVGDGVGTFRIYHPDQTSSVQASGTFTTSASADFAQRTSVKGLPDGRFVIIWLDTNLEVRGQMFFADGAKDGAEFAVATVTAGDQGRPTIDMLADGRFAVAWETSESGSAQIKYTIFDPRVGNQIITGTADADFFEGSGFNDAIYGGLGNDQLRGAAGADYLRGDDGADALQGGDGSDLLFGEQQADSLAGDNGDDFLYGGPGNDVLSGNAGHDVLYGEENDDRLNGDADDDVLIGGAGVDLMNGGDGADSADGGVDDDTFYGGAGADYATGGEGRDTLNGEAGADQLYGGAGIDAIDGGDDNDTIYGGTDSDNLQGGQGDDVLIGEAGSDWIAGGVGADSIDGGDDSDTLYGDMMASPFETGDDYIQGGAGSDFLYGGPGADMLDGGADGDWLEGGSGGDTMSGGSGGDVFRFAAGSGVDVITDFTDTVDRFDLLGYAGAHFGNTIIAQSGADTVIAFGGGFADQVILLNFTATNVTIDDFIGWF